MGSYYLPDNITESTWKGDYIASDLCPGFESYSISSSNSTSWASAIVHAAAYAFSKAGYEERFSLKYVLKCLPEFSEAQSNEIRTSDIISFIAENGLMTDRVASSLSEDDLCSSTANNYKFEVIRNDVPNESGLKNFANNGNPVIVLLALDLLRLQTVNSVTGTDIYRGATDEPSVYGILEGYEEDKWTVGLNVVPCEHIVLNLPVTDNETNANYAGIAGYAFSLVPESLPSPSPSTEEPTEKPTTAVPTTLPPTEKSTPTPTPTPTSTPTPTPTPTPIVTLPPCPEGLVAYRIIREYGANPSSSERMTFNFGTGSDVFLSMIFNGNATESITGCMKPQLLNIVLEGTTTGWNEDSYFKIESEFGDSDRITLQGSSSNTLYFHNLFGFISVTEVTSCNDFHALPDSVNMIHVTTNACNDESIVEFSTERFSDLVDLFIEDENFMYVTTFNVQNNSNLQYIHIQENSFTQRKNSYGNDVSKSFHILNCESLESIQIGERSFSDFAGDFELKNLPQLQSIQIGTIGRYSYNFCSSSFVIRGIELILNTVMIRSSKSTIHYIR